MTATATLQARLATVILADPDVRIIYPTQSTLRAIGDRIAGAVNDREFQSPILTIAETSEGTTVSVSIGVRAERAATTVCRRLHDRIADEMATATVALPVSIAVKVASIG